MTNPQASGVYFSPKVDRYSAEVSRMSACQLCRTIAVLIVLIPVTTLAQQFISFDVPEAGNGFAQGTNPASLNDVGQVTGSYKDANDVNHGFLRRADGSIVTFDAPNAGWSANQGTLPVAINRMDQIAGYFLDSVGTSHGFLRKAAGKIIVFDVTGSIRTSGRGIDPRGQVVGSYLDSNGVGPRICTNQNGRIHFL